MKKFQDYLAESEKVYSYRIKVVGELPSGFAKELKDKLEQFGVAKMGEFKSTPVQAKPADFPAYENQRVNSAEVNFRYPAIEPQVKQIVQLMGMDPNCVVMQTQAFDDSMASEKEKIETENKDLLTNTDFPAPDAEQKALKADHSAAYGKHAVLKNAYRSDFTIAGGRTPPAKTTNDLPQNNDSPFSRNKRPPKPATGSHPNP